MNPAEEAVAGMSSVVREIVTESVTVGEIATEMTGGALGLLPPISTATFPVKSPDPQRP